ncbi:hypothetical protein HanRHA438_Chr01g0045001 [Helianthus annuus]|uniref:Uncharacterized protein n=1 Tax=Helianthus annuus TaxID=4232 RepID=A0A251VTN3_HELAN|nr:uncharacterized protein LOC110883798 [Helianthus annuus]KAF5823975.1 hypothetical protein HanXRQr2_Chr01g0044081 [Helianthus annuus]KAJ0628631.1 hypothetical protein HanHA89_Chr01g0038581 [Helianthus annuus]KAJ0950037.1 hypothetical protein HanRHA438_Chr01g0045001 [Helianthus annuus]
MVLTTTSCLHPRPPTATPTTTQPPPSARPKREISWRKQCVVGMACVIIGLQMEGIVGNSHDLAIAIEPKATIESKVKGKRWSNKRICPAWQLNSLETIVPEDLPRPSSKRRWEAVGNHLRVAPPHKSSTTTTITLVAGDCFSL